jgi:FlaA1/EpsC-like NDP-sugar epimerase
MLAAWPEAPLLITGAGGSIGSALALRLAESSTSRLVLLEASEARLYQLKQAMASVRRNADATFVLGNAGDSAMLEEIFVAHRPRIVFHAAAHKHVPLLETQPLAAIANNVFATEMLVAAAARRGARVVLLSTDKAVQPASVMGATKRVAEEIVLASGGMALRLANVLGSSGGVTEVFREQIAHGGPMTVTNPEACRYFLSMEEAVDLLLATASIAKYTVSATLLCPALEADYSIAELAGFMARALAPGREIPIHFTGLRPGDKLAERLWDDGECASSAADGLLSIRSNRPQPQDFASGVAALRSASQERDLAEALKQLCILVPDYRPSQSVLALAQDCVPREFV